MIEVRNLTKRYGDLCAVRNLSFTVEKGKIYGFLGPNGAGKSTTMNMLCGCLAPSEGEIFINGHDILASPKQARRLIGYLPEHPPLYPDMTPMEYLHFVGEAKGMKRADIAAQSEEILHRVDVWDKKDRLICNLSKGYQQRIGIAQAMMGDPEIIILDEPTVGLDPRQVIGIRRLIAELGKEHTVILSSHILPEISAVCDHVMILSHGKLVANDSLLHISSYLTGNRQVEMTLRGEVNAIKMALNSIEQVLSYEIGQTKEEGVYCVSMECQDSNELRDRLFFAFCELRFPIYALSSKTVTLEDVFLGLTAEEEEDGMKNGLRWNEEFVTEEETDGDGEDEYEEYEDDAEEEEAYRSMFRRPGGEEQ